MKKATSYIVAVHSPIAGTSLLPLVFGWPPIVLPAHIAFLELIIDPACSIAFEAEPEGPDVMRRPPRNRSESLYSRAQLLRSLVDGLAVLGVVVFVYVVTRGAGYDDDQVRTLTFIALVLGNLGLILSGRSRTRGLAATMVTPNRMLWWVVAGPLTGLVAVLAVPSLRNVFKFSMPDGHALRHVLRSASACCWSWSSSSGMSEHCIDREGARCPIQTTSPSRQYRLRDT